MRPTLTFVSDSQLIKERQLKSFAASLEAIGQKVHGDLKSLKNALQAQALTLVDHGVALEGGLSCPGKALVLRSMAAYRSQREVDALLGNLLGSGVDIALLGTSDYLDMPALRLVLLSRLGASNIDLSKTLAFGGVHTPVAATAGCFDPGLKELFKEYRLGPELSKELSLFTKMLGEYFGASAASFELLFVADGLWVGLVQRVVLKKPLSPRGLYKIFKHLLPRSKGQLTIKAQARNELQLSYFVSNIEDLTQHDMIRVGWFATGAEKLINSDKK